MALFKGGEDDEPMALHGSTIISKKNFEVTNIFIPIELPKNSMEDHSFMKLGDFCIDVKHIKEVEGSILPSMLTFE